MQNETIDLKNIPAYRRFKKNTYFFDIGVMMNGVFGLVWFLGWVFFVKYFVETADQPWGKIVAVAITVLSLFFLYQKFSRWLRLGQASCKTVPVLQKIKGESLGAPQYVLVKLLDGEFIAEVPYREFSKIREGEYVVVFSEGTHLWALPFEYQSQDFQVL